MNDKNFLKIAVAAFVVLLQLAVNLQAQKAKAPRPEYPRPDLMRSEWRTQNGAWEFEFDDANRGMAEGWYKSASKKFSRTIQVPFAFQTRLSGINDSGYHDTVWYRRALDIPASFRAVNKRVMLNFGAVDYEAIVWIKFSCETHEKNEKRKRFS